MKLSYVELVFNDEFGSLILGHNIGTFFICNIQPCFAGVAGEAAPDDFAGDVAIEIHKNANKEEDEDDYLDLFSRICAYNNITQVRFQFENDHTLYSFKVDNNFQKTYISSLGHLYIAISPRGLKNFFDIDNLENKQIVDAHFRKDIK